MILSTTVRRFGGKGNLTAESEVFRSFLLFFFAKKDFVKSVLLTLKQLNANKKLVAQAERKLKEFKDDKDNTHPKLYLTTDLGSKIWFFSFAELSTYEKHSILRKSLAADFENLKKEALFADVRQLPKGEQKQVINALAALITLSQWEAPKVSAKKKAEKQITLSFEVATALTDKELKSTFDEGQVMAEANNLVRTLSDTPSNRLTPAVYLDLIHQRAKKLKYKVEFHDRKALTKIGAGSFLAVTQGNLDDKGGIAHLTYKPTQKKKKKLLLVGKGLCFDTGGYNIKTGPHMYGMQKDMTGSALALSVFEAVIRLKLPIEVHAFLGLAENLISHQAYKPSDVVTASDGTSIEVTDTDAEGRMVLADVLAMARREGGDLVLDFATLTGSVIRALDTRRAGVFSNRPKLLGKAYEVGEACGERVWGFPLGEDYREHLKSSVADILQCRILPNADHIYAATFLSHFIGNEIPWIHMDLAPADNLGGLGLVSTNSTGFGVRWALAISKEIFGVR